MLLLMKSNMDKKLKTIPKWLALFFFWFIILYFFGIIFFAIYKRDDEKHFQNITSKTKDFIKENRTKDTLKSKTVVTKEMLKDFIETDPQLQKEIKNKASVIADKEFNEKWRNVSLEEIFKSNIEFLNAIKKLLNTKIDDSNKQYLQEGMRLGIEMVSGLIKSQKSIVPRSLENLLVQLKTKEQEIISYKNEK
jgi:hypothetical protein